jgi:hypothetical protein
VDSVQIQVTVAFIIDTVSILANYSCVYLVSVQLLPFATTV